MYYFSPFFFSYNFLANGLPQNSHCMVNGIYSLGCPSWQSESPFDAKLSLIYILISNTSHIADTQ